MSVPVLPEPRHRPVLFWFWLLLAPAAIAILIAYAMAPPAGIVAVLMLMLPLVVATVVTLHATRPRLVRSLVLAYMLDVGLAVGGMILARRTIGEQHWWAPLRLGALFVVLAFPVIVSVVMTVALRRDHA